MSIQFWNLKCLNTRDKCESVFEHVVFSSNKIMKQLP